MIEGRGTRTRARRVNTPTESPFQQQYTRYDEHTMTSPHTSQQSSARSHLPSTLLPWMAPPSDASSDGGKPTDGVVATYDQHEDSVYSVAWSSGDPWIFASLSRKYYKLNFSSLFEALKLRCLAKVF
ncbi:hypothetical protein SeMB42_g00262 [Synchytrium endobioticum]|uniref:Uncharacterized protein n=1 Tax=Synchytrium endobioticum TaxID=286115 RepID=A0A507DRV1_9FUNG|nr:hypothetical protein SeMB42_g00262 [Synchytrium endobioticum]